MDTDRLLASPSSVRNWVPDAWEQEGFEIYGLNPISEELDELWEELQEFPLEFLRAYFHDPSLDKKQGQWSMLDTTWDGAGSDRLTVRSYFDDLSWQDSLSGAYEAWEKATGQSP